MPMLKKVPIPLNEENSQVTTEQQSIETTPPIIEETPPESQASIEETPVIVNSLDELQTAIDTANDGDIIFILAKK